MLGRTCDSHNAPGASNSSHGAEGLPRTSNLAIGLKLTQIYRRILGWNPVGDLTLIYGVLQKDLRSSCMRGKIQGALLLLRIMYVSKAAEGFDDGSGDSTLWLQKII